MKNLIVVLAFLLAAPVQALTLGQVRDAADARLTTLWVNVIRPGELAWFAERGVYGQCLHTQNIPDTAAADAVVAELIPVTDVRIHDSNRESCRDIFGAVNINVSLPFAIAVHVYDGPSGKGFVGAIWVKFNGTLYTKAKNYGPETWRTHDWEEVTEVP